MKPFWGIKTNDNLTIFYSSKNVSIGQNKYIYN